MRGQKQRHDENERENTNRHSALKDYTKPSTKVKIQRQKVPDDEDIDIDKIVKGDKPKDDRNSATKIEKQYKEKEAKRLALEKAKRIQIQKDMKDKEAKRFALEKAQIEALIRNIDHIHQKHLTRLVHWVQAKMPKVMVERGSKRKNPHIKRQQKIVRLKSPIKRAKKPKMPIKAIRIHF